MDRDAGHRKCVAKRGRWRVGHRVVEMVERTDDLERARLELGVVDDQQPALAALEAALAPRPAISRRAMPARHDR